jgi:predicted HTH transcriptional regulator
LIGIGERAGSGIPDIYQVWKDEGWAEPKIVERYNPDRTKLTLSFAKSDDKKATIKSDDKKPAIKTGDKKPAIKTGDKKPAIKNRAKQAGSRN